MPGPEGHFCNRCGTALSDENMRPSDARSRIWTCKTCRLNRQPRAAPAQAVSAAPAEKPAQAVAPKPAENTAAVLTLEPEDRQLLDQIRLLKKSPEFKRMLSAAAAQEEFEDELNQPVNEQQD